MVRREKAGRSMVVRFDPEFRYTPYPKDAFPIVVLLHFEKNVPRSLVHGRWSVNYGAMPI